MLEPSASAFVDDALNKEALLAVKCGYLRADKTRGVDHWLLTQAGKKLYAKCKSTVEPVFGIIKAVMGFSQFLNCTPPADAVGRWNSTDLLMRESRSVIGNRTVRMVGRS